MNQRSRKIFVALPVMDEAEQIANFFSALSKQDYNEYELYVCVNQPDFWWHIEDKKEVCSSNQSVLDYLKDKPCQIIDKTSKGKGWQNKNFGVGWARKVLMDAINEVADSQDVIISLDADTHFNPQYFSSVVEMLNNKHISALANPYYHKLTGYEDLDRAMLRYEIYMRCYALNLWHIRSPYAFTALGSAIALPVETYRKMGGMTPKKSGEDFYFLQKIRKFGKIATWNSEKVYPATRYSDRVFFGTGPALIKGSKGDWQSYPIYHYSLFKPIEEVYNMLTELYDNPIIATPIDNFFNEKLNENIMWHALRKNAGSQKAFINAFHQKFDGLRILQYLKWQNGFVDFSDEQSLIQFLDNFYSNSFNFCLDGFDFSKSDISLLDNIRNFLMEKENGFQYNDYINNLHV